jgi:hypothetical protein
MSHHACYPNYPEGEDQEGLQFKTILGKKLARLSSSKHKLAVVGHIYNPRYMGGRSRRIITQGQPWQKCETLSKK